MKPSPSGGEHEDFIVPELATEGLLSSFWKAIRMFR
jgi:hypothetical protein